MVINGLGFISMSLLCQHCLHVYIFSVQNLELSAMLISGDFKIMDASSAIRFYSWFWRKSKLHSRKNGILKVLTCIFQEECMLRWWDRCIDHHWQYYRFWLPIQQQLPSVRAYCSMGLLGRSLCEMSCSVGLWHENKLWRDCELCCLSQMWRSSQSHKIQNLLFLSQLR